MLRKVERYSDNLLLALARSRMVEFRKNDLELSGRVEVEHDSRHIAAAVERLASEMAEKALPEARRMLAEDS